MSKIQSPKMQFRFSNFEFSLVQILVWLIFWLVSEWLANLLTLILLPMLLAILALAMISEWIEKSNVPRRYFYLMAISVAAPVVAFVVYFVIHTLFSSGKIEYFAK